MSKPKHRWWTIWVRGWGVYEFYGTEDEAEKSKRHKSTWEQEPAKMYLGKLKGQITDEGKLK